MSRVNDTKRQRTVLGLALTAAIVWVLLLLSGLGGGTPDMSHDRMGEPVLPGFAEARVDTQKIRFTSSDDSYSLLRTSGGWVMEEAGGYPIRGDRLSALVTDLENLSFDAKRTDDEGKLERLGLGDPATGGSGVLLELYGPDDRKLNAIIVGRKNDTIYVREPGRAQSYRAIGDLPPFYTRRAWLDFDVVDIDASAIRSVRLIDQNGKELYLRRPAGGGARSFVPAPPHQDDELISRLAASTTALAITRLSPNIDSVKPASALTTRPIGRHISETFDGLEIDLRAYREADGAWITLRAIEAGEGARRAQAINEKAEGWAFKLPEYDFQDYVPPISSLVIRAETTED